MSKSNVISLFDEAQKRRFTYKTGHANTVYLHNLNYEVTKQPVTGTGMEGLTKAADKKSKRASK